jgi:hypothetical protein
MESNVENKDKIAQKPGDVVEARDAPSVTKGVVDDHDDIQNAQTELHEQPIDKRKSLLRIGPGLITGVADGDPSGIGTYSVAGAQFGYQLLWLAPVCVSLGYCRGLPAQLRAGDQPGQGTSLFGRSQWFARTSSHCCIAIHLQQS